LSQTRASGMDIQRISVSDILSYMRMLSINDIGYRKILFERILILDNEFMSIRAEKADKKSKSESKSEG